MNLFINRSSPTLLFQRMQSWVKLQVIVSSLSAGLVTGVIGGIRAISYGSLIFSGALVMYLPTGLGVTVFSEAIVTGRVGIMSALPGLIAPSLAAPTAILAINGNHFSIRAAT